MHPPPDAVSCLPSSFQAILANRADGASALFDQFVKSACGKPLDTVLAGLRACRDTFPLMAVWPYALARLTEEQPELEPIATQMAAQGRAVVAGAAKTLAGLNAVATLSNSSLVRRALLTCDPPPQVLCAVSQPGGEGRHLASMLNEAGIRAALVKDSQQLQRLAQVQAVLLGTDQYDHSGFINKVGSGELARHARLREIPVLVLAEEFKRVDRLPRLTTELVSLELEVEGRTASAVVFERIPWQPHIRLVSNDDS